MAISGTVHKSYKEVIFLITQYIWVDDLLFELLYYSPATVE